MVLMACFLLIDPVSPYSRAVGVTEAITVVTMAQNVLDLNRFLDFMEVLEVLRTALEEKSYTWPAIQAIAAQYGYEWDSLGLEGKPEPMSANGLKRLIKEFEAASTTETSSEASQEPLEGDNGTVELINSGVTVSPGQDDRQWYEYRRPDGSTFRSYTQL